MDTHDCATQSQDQMLQPGVVMTLEPGLYIPDSPKYGRFAGIGIRLEDDVGITSTGTGFYTPDQLGFRAIFYANIAC